MRHIPDSVRQALQSGVSVEVNYNEDVFRATEKKFMDGTTTAMIGDTIYDMIMAKEALVTAIGVSWGYHDTGELKEAGARIIAQDCAELQPALRALWRLP